MRSNSSAARRGSRRGWLGALGLALVMATGSGCFVVERSDHGRDGYRRVEDEDFRYRSDDDLYVGVNLPSVYWVDGDFWRPRGDEYWEWSRHPRGPWYSVDDDHVPSRLRKAHGKSPRYKKNDRRDNDHDRD